MGILKKIVGYESISTQEKRFIEALDREDIDLIQLEGATKKNLLDIHRRLKKILVMMKEKKPRSSELISAVHNLEQQLGLHLKNVERNVKGKIRDLSAVNQLLSNIEQVLYSH
jgi:capsule polysaccharide export protein KpsE/RkpR